MSRKYKLSGHVQVVYFIFELQKIQSVDVFSVKFPNELSYTIAIFRSEERSL